MKDVALQFSQLQFICKVSTRCKLFFVLSSYFLNDLLCSLTFFFETEMKYFKKAVSSNSFAVNVFFFRSFCFLVRIDHGFPSRERIFFGRPLRRDASISSLRALVTVSLVPLSSSSSSSLPDTEFSSSKLFEYKVRRSFFSYLSFRSSARLAIENSIRRGISRIHSEVSLFLWEFASIVSPRRIFVKTFR